MGGNQHAVVGTIEQHERARRFANPTSAACDIYYNWRDVTNERLCAPHERPGEEESAVRKGQNSTLSYCALDNQGNMRNEDPGSIEL